MARCGHAFPAQGVVGVAGDSTWHDHELRRAGGASQRAEAARAVGHANGANPISIVIPCHRLIGADGSLVKYGGGLSRKRWLLQHEGAL